MKRFRSSPFIPTVLVALLCASMVGSAFAESKDTMRASVRAASNETLTKLYGCLPCSWLASASFCPPRSAPLATHSHQHAERLEESVRVREVRFKRAG
ncbi:MAG: hypothetical protein Q8K12_07015 [Thiobacillus sp.]|nr:hypothetical protein [Thiobacillus sp.]